VVGSRFRVHLPLIDANALDRRGSDAARSRAGHRIVATMVTVPEIDGTFVEIETLVPDGQPPDDGQRAIRGVLTDLGLGEDDLEPTLYVDLVTARRADEG
jgi:adenylate cyclase class 2